MKKVLMGLAALPFLAGAATAGQPLTDQQLDRVTAGFTATSISDAQGVVGESGIVLTTVATLSEVAPFATAKLGETSSTLFKSVAAAQASSVTSTFSPAPIPGLSGPVGP
jgi:pectate lyase